MALRTSDIQSNTDGWFCENGTCYQHPNGTLTYAQCKASCTDHPCSMFGEMCADYIMVINGNHPSFAPGNVSGLLGHWVNMFALQTMGGYNFTKPQLFAYIQKCCDIPPSDPTPPEPTLPQARIKREVRENFYNLPALSNNVPIQDSVLGGVIAPRQSKYSMGNMANPLMTDIPRAIQDQPPSTYDNQAITSMENFLPYSPNTTPTGVGKKICAEKSCKMKIKTGGIFGGGHSLFGLFIKKATINVPCEMNTGGACVCKGTDQSC